MQAQVSPLLLVIDEFTFHPTVTRLKSPPHYREVWAIKQKQPLLFRLEAYSGNWLAIRSGCWSGAGTGSPALLSSLFRAGIFFTANLAAGWRAAVAAMFAELLYRGVSAGFFGALTQAFRQAQPAWLATATAMVLLPLASHSLGKSATGRAHE